MDSWKLRIVEGVAAGIGASVIVLMFQWLLKPSVKNCEGIWEFYQPTYLGASPPQELRALGSLHLNPQSRSRASAVYCGVLQGNRANALEATLSNSRFQCSVTNMGEDNYSSQDYIFLTGWIDLESGSLTMQRTPPAEANEEQRKEFAMQEYRAFPVGSRNCEAFEGVFVHHRDSITDSPQVFTLTHRE